MQLAEDKGVACCHCCHCCHCSWSFFFFFLSLGVIRHRGKARQCGSPYFSILHYFSLSRFASHHIQGCSERGGMGGGPRKKKHTHSYILTYTPKKNKGILEICRSHGIEPCVITNAPTYLQPIQAPSLPPPPITSKPHLGRFSELFLMFIAIDLTGETFLGYAE